MPNPLIPESAFQVIIPSLTEVQTIPVTDNNMPVELSPGIDYQLVTSFSLLNRPANNQSLLPTSLVQVPPQNTIVDKKDIHLLSLVPNVIPNPITEINQFQTATPSNDGVLTVRTLNTASPSNRNLLTTYNIVPFQTIPVVPYEQGTCFNGVTDDYLINSKEELFIYLCNVLIRFDTNPNFYQKEDYEALLRLLVGSLLHLYNVNVSPTPYKITTSPYVLQDVIPVGHLVKNIMVYNNEAFPVTMSLGYTEFGEELLMSETMESKIWTNLVVNKLLSTTDSSSLYFNCNETLTNDGIYVVIESNFYFSEQSKI